MKPAGQVKFQSTPHCESEANLPSATCPLNSRGFNPRLTARARRTCCRSPFLNGRESFNPRLTARARRTWSPSRFIPVEKFQSTPHCESEANADRQTCAQAHCEFQSTPHCESEANRRLIAAEYSAFCFNPRLTARARRTFFKDVCGFNLHVSIHASLRERGEPNRNTAAMRSDAFQSTPHCESEANAAQEVIMSIVAGFNPRLTARARRTKAWQPIAEGLKVSIHASLRERGELVADEHGYGPSIVSIHASLRERGEPCVACFRHTARRSFNPRLTARARRTLYRGRPI